MAANLRPRISRPSYGAQPPQAVQHPIVGFAPPAIPTIHAGTFTVSAASAPYHSGGMPAHGTIQIPNFGAGARPISELVKALGMRFHSGAGNSGFSFGERTTGSMADVEQFI